VIDRAVILARGGALDFDLPSGEAELRANPTRSQVPPDGEDPRFLTELEMRERERNNLLAVLEKSGWRVKGANGAAELLGIKPTTLVSRIKKLGLKRAT
jgi:transcriptional regulator with GAF, ATPase, and Fis domain